MSFVAKLQRAREVLEQQRRLSARALARELDIAGDELEELIAELVDVQGVAVELDLTPHDRHAYQMASLGSGS
ncbi:MAG: hypothetical protein ACREI7_01250 [Myxococcota bacterium]